MRESIWHHGVIKMPAVLPEEPDNATELCN